MKGIGIFIVIFLATVFIKSLAFAENATDRMHNTAEKYFIEQIKKGETVDLAEKFPEKTDRVIEADFLQSVLTEPEIKGKGVTIKNARIKKSLGLRNTKISFALRFESCIFEENIEFQDVIFKENIEFQDVTFKKNLNIYSTTFSGEANFSEATFSKEANFPEAAFSGQANFSNAAFRGAANFSGATFSGKAFFDYAKFAKRADSSAEVADFSKAKFLGEAVFESAEFSKKANFSEVEISGKADFTDAKFHEKAEFYDAKIKGEMVFISAKFAKATDFSKAEFSGKENFFTKAEFSEKADFSKVKFYGKASFSDTKFTKKADSSAEAADFSKVEFAEKANFTGAGFSGMADFSKATFVGETLFISAKFNEAADFSKAEFSAKANFTRTDFSGLADFSKATFVGKTLFISTKFNETADFSKVGFSGAAEFKSCSFKGKSKFTECLFPLKNKIHFDNVSGFSAMEMEWIYVPEKYGKKVDKTGNKNSKRRGLKHHLNYDETFYIALIKNYSDMGWLSQADDAYYTYQVEKRKFRRGKLNEIQAADNIRPNINRLFENIKLMFNYLMLDFTFGYGVKPKNLLRTLILFWIPFAFYYVGFLRISPGESLPWWQAWNPFYKPNRLAWALIFSLDTLTPGINFESFETIGKKVFIKKNNKRVLYVRRFQEALGWYLVALFLIMFGKVWIR